MENKKLKTVFGIILLSFGIIIAVVITAFCVLKIRTNKITDNYSSVYADKKYTVPVSTNKIDVFKQDISCGYALIQMFSSWAGKTITEQDLYNQYGKVVTSTGKSFCAEMNKQFPEYKTTMYKYLPATELLSKVYDSLLKGIPVPFEWAAKYNDEWTLHYSLITGLDVPNNKVTVANPYGYYEELTLEEFFNRTSYKAYSNMPFFFKFAFAFGIFEKNTIFIVE